MHWRRRRSPAPTLPRRCKAVLRLALAMKRRIAVDGRGDEAAQRSLCVCKLFAARPVLQPDRQLFTPSTPVFGPANAGPFFAQCEARVRTRGGDLRGLALARLR